MNISEDERNLFRDGLGEVRIHRSNHHYDPPPPPPPRLQPRTGSEEMRKDWLADPLGGENNLPSHLIFHRGGVQLAVLRRLRRGQLPIEAELDLHGMTRHEARQALLAFLERASHWGLRHLRIIHGQGHRSHPAPPILKSHVSHWLPQHPAVLAYCPAPRRQGGEGALLVLLGRRRNPIHSP
jgi:DNA-nicking Smr family endonuclease